MTDILLRVSAAGIFAYSVFNVVAGGLGVHTDLRNILVLAVGGVTIIQVTVSLPWGYSLITKHNFVDFRNILHFYSSQNIFFPKAIIIKF